MAACLLENTACDRLFSLDGSLRIDRDRMNACQCGGLSHRSAMLLRCVLRCVDNNRKTGSGRYGYWTPRRDEQESSNTWTRQIEFWRVAASPGGFSRAQKGLRYYGSLSSRGSENIVLETNRSRETCRWYRCAPGCDIGWEFLGVLCEDYRSYITK